MNFSLLKNLATFHQIPFTHNALAITQ